MSHLDHRADRRVPVRRVRGENLGHVLVLQELPDAVRRPDGKQVVLSQVVSAVRAGGRGGASTETKEREIRHTSARISEKERRHFCRIERETIVHKKSGGSNEQAKATSPIENKNLFLFLLQATRTR